jgi:hypothetical protein
MMRTLREKYAANGRIGYICAERFDGRLTKTDAVKILHIQEQESFWEKAAFSATLAALCSFLVICLVFGIRRTSRLCGKP